MTRYVIGPDAALRLAHDRYAVSDEHQVVAPTLLRSQTLSALHGAVHDGALSSDLALERLAHIWAMPIRLLGDAVLRRKAWKLAEQLGCAHSAPGRRVRHPRCGSGAPSRGNRPDGDDRGTEDRLTSVHRLNAIETG